MRHKNNLRIATKVSNPHYIQTPDDVVYFFQRHDTRRAESRQQEGDHLTGGRIVTVKLEVSEKTRQKTDKCWRGFACLSNATNGVCAVRDQVGDVLFVEKTRQAYCPYDVTFGYSHICSCPVRHELFERYGK